MDIEPESIELHTLLLDLNITYEQLIDLGILIGTDYNPDGFRKVGPVTSLKYILGLANNIVLEIF